MTEARRRLHFLYHELRPSGSEYSYVVETGEFKRQADLFAAVRGAATVEVWPEVTFDDGHISNFEYALPILQSRDLKARFFITVGWTGQKAGYMGWGELRLLHEAGQLIGAHGWSHTLLTHCNERELQTELSGARLTLEDRLGTSITTMSLPGGRYNRRVLAACREAGYTQIFTSIPRAEPLQLGPTVGRLNVRGDMQVEWIASLLRPGSKALSDLERQYQLKTMAKTVLGDQLYERLWALVNRREPDNEAGGATAE